MGTHEDEKTVDGTKPNTNPKTKTKTKTNPNPNTNPNPKLNQILTLFSCFMLFWVPFPDLQSSPIMYNTEPIVIKVFEFYTVCDMLQCL